MEEVISLIIPFIALALISVMTDRLTMVLEAIMKKVPKLPDSFEWWIAYFIVLGISYVVCDEGNFDLFLYLHLTFSHPWEGYLLTALVLSGGSSFVRTQFTMIDKIPSVLSTIMSSIKNMAVPSIYKEIEREIEEKGPPKDEHFIYLGKSSSHSNVNSKHEKIQEVNENE